MLEAALPWVLRFARRETALVTVKCLLCRTSLKIEHKVVIGQQQLWIQARSNGAQTSAMSGAKKIKSAVFTKNVEPRVKVTKRNVRGMTNTSQVISNISYNSEQ